jgi:oxygen-independent coproporphyrinogen-3 oxidase
MNGKIIPIVPHGQLAKKAVTSGEVPLEFRNALPLSLYVHIPWCVQKCPYCDFNSHEARAGIPEKEYVAALIADLESGDAVWAAYSSAAARPACFPEKPSTN